MECRAGARIDIGTQDRHVVVLGIVGSMSTIYFTSIYCYGRESCTSNRHPRCKVFYSANVSLLWIYDWRRTNIITAKSCKLCEGKYDFLSEIFKMMTLTSIPGYENAVCVKIDQSTHCELPIDDGSKGDFMQWHNLKTPRIRVFIRSWWSLGRHPWPTSLLA